MPGLSQLKKFSSDLLALGDEVVVRAGRGEKPVTVPIPKDVQDIDDSEDFVIGMPEGEELAEEEQVDDDLSDLANISSGSSNSTESVDDSSSVASSPFETPDMSGLLDPIGGGDFDGDDMPDLSMFADEPVAEAEPEPEEFVEEEPEEVAVADMGLEDLLSGGGFDEPEDDNISDLDDLGSGSNSSEIDNNDGSFELDDFGDIEDAEPLEEVDSLDSNGIDQFGDFDDFGDLGAVGGDVPDVSVDDKDSVEPVGDDSLDDFFYEPFGEDDKAGADNGSVEKNVDADDGKVEDDSFVDAEPADVLDSLGGDDNEPFEKTGEDAVKEPDSLDTVQDDFDIPEGSDISEENNISAESDGGDFGDLSDLPDFDDIGSDGAIADDLSDVSDSGSGDDFDLPDFDNLESGSDNLGTDSLGTDTLGTDNLETDDFGADDILADNVSDSGDVSDSEGVSGDFDLPDFSDNVETDNVANKESDDVLDSVTEDVADALTDIKEPVSDISNDESDNRFSDSLDTDLDSPFNDFAAEDTEPLPTGTDAAGIDESGSDTGFDLPGLDDDFGSGDVTAKDDIPDYGDYNIDEESFDSGDNSEPLETFDTSEMEGLDFDIPDTDTQLETAESGDDLFDNDEFEIPGFSDVDTVSESSGKTKIVNSDDKKKKAKHPAAPVKTDDNEEDLEAENLPPNTLSDKQYKIFLKNLNEYPLNVRLAFEEVMVRDELTDDAEFEIIKAILDKISARQLATKLEKMLDISIPVPRDYEHRSAGEYEAYKKSLSYQLKNRIIPAVLLGIVGILVCIGLFNFGKNCIYKPLKANSLYKQGYVLIQEREYPLSEIKFEEATEYRLSKKWFFNYARAYREHKQYQRAGKMYRNILYCFNHDKEAGLEYADMELDDLANYEKAEEIVRREVLDYHINDADGILKLGDIFLEWGTEKDPSKLENAREQYATLLQIYGQNDLYLSRMMRYFIRTDNLREVLQLKQHFEPEEESLCSDDWTELSGYLLDKYYGELSPSEEYLRYEIEGLRSLLLRAVKSNPANPVALYNLSKYFINTSENEYIEQTLQDSIEKFNSAKSLKNREIYKYIDAYRLLGEYYVNTDDFLQAQEQFAEGISLYITERDNAGFKGNKGVGKLYEDMGNLKYSISGDYDEALLNYNQSVNLGNDNPSIRYRIGYVQYHNRDYDDALAAFMKAGDGNIKERNLLLAMANTLSIRGNDYAAEGYYGQLIETLDNDIASKGLILPQANEKDYNIVNTYLCATNNYGVTLYRLAKKTGNSGKNAEAIVQFSESLKAWDALTRNPETMVRLEGTNLAEENIKYITHPISEFEPAIYTSIPKTLLDNEGI